MDTKLSNVLQENNVHLNIKLAQEMKDVELF